jgi:ribosomal protein L40E
MGPHVKYPSIYKRLLRNRKKYKYVLQNFIHCGNLFIYNYINHDQFFVFFPQNARYNITYNDKMVITFLTEGFISKDTEWIGIQCDSHGLRELLIFKFNVLICRSCGAPNSHKTHTKYCNFYQKILTCKTRLSFVI